MGTSTSTRKRTANGSTQGIPKTFGVQFWLEDPDDLDTLRSRLIIPQSDGTEKTEDVVEDFAERVLRFRAHDLARERAEDEDDDDGDEIRPIRRPKRKSRFDEDDDGDDISGADDSEDEYEDSGIDDEEDEEDRPSRNGRRGRR
jgi:hypothetical protein